jgi:chromosome segregation ATPase
MKTKMEESEFKLLEKELELHDEKEEHQQDIAEAERKISDLKVTVETLQKEKGCLAINFSFYCSFYSFDFCKRSCKLFSRFF